MENEEIPTEKEAAKIPGAKAMSKMFKLLAVFGIIFCHVAKWADLIDAESTEICFMWAVVYGLGAGTIDLNIMIDKFRR